MSYTRLSLQDYKDKWNAAKVRHLEDGIVNNDVKISNILSGNFSSDEKENIQETLEIKEIKGHTTLDTFIPLWHTLLSEGGKKIRKPDITFDGNLNGKVMLPAPQKGLCENTVSYVRISDYVRLGYVAMTLGGLGHVLLHMSGLMPNNSDNLIDKLEGYNHVVAPNSGGATMMECLFPNQNIVSGAGVTQYESLYKSLFAEMFLDLSSNADGDTGEMRTMFAGLCSDDLPAAFSIDHDFEYNGISYPAGFYSLYIDFSLDFVALTNGDSMLPALVEGMKKLPLLYVDNIWILLAGESDHEDIYVYPDYLREQETNYNNSNTFAFNFSNNDTLFWTRAKNKFVNSCVANIDGVNETLNSICSEPEKFLNAAMKASDIIYSDSKASLDIYANTTGSDIPQFMKYYRIGLDILIFIDPVHIILEDYNSLIPPGVYYIGENDSFTLKLEGSNIKSMFVKEPERNTRYFDLTTRFTSDPINTWDWQDPIDGVIEAAESGYPVKFKISVFGMLSEIPITFGYSYDDNMYQGTFRGFVTQEEQEVEVVVSVMVSGSTERIAMRYLLIPTLVTE